MADGTQELESRISPVVELGQTGLDSCLIHDVSFGFWAAYVESVAEASICPPVSSSVVYASIILNNCSTVDLPFIKPN